MSIKQISVFLENKAGAMLSMTQVLAEKKIDKSLYRGLVAYEYS